MNAGASIRSGSVHLEQSCPSPGNPHLAKCHPVTTTLKKEKKTELL